MAHAAAGERAISTKWEIPFFFLPAGAFLPRIARSAAALTAAID